MEGIKFQHHFTGFQAFRASSRFPKQVFGYRCVLFRENIFQNISRVLDSFEACFRDFRRCSRIIERMEAPETHQSNNLGFTLAAF